MGSYTKVTTDSWYVFNSRILCIFFSGTRRVGRPTRRLETGPAGSLSGLLNESGADSVSRCCLSETLNLRVCTLFKQLILASIIPITLRKLYIETLVVYIVFLTLVVLLFVFEAWKGEGDL